MKTETIPAKDGHKAIHFMKGGLHKSLGVAADKKIPKSKLRAALSGKEGPKAERQALFMKNVLKGK